VAPGEKLITDNCKARPGYHLVERAARKTRDKCRDIAKVEVDRQIERVLKRPR
jgi:hypothetical protein